MKAEASSVLDEPACRRVEGAGVRTGRVHLHRVQGGHWLNADNPEALIELMLSAPGGKLQGGASTGG